MAKTPASKKVRAFPVVASKFGCKKKSANLAKTSSKSSKTPAKSLENVKVSAIKCKAKRLDVFFRRKREMKRLQRKRKSEACENPEKNHVTPQTTDDKREFSEDFVAEEHEELANEEKFDEFAAHFSGLETPKLLLTTSEKPSRQLFDFLKEIKTVFPNTHYYPRQRFTLQEICQYSKNRGYTAVMVFRESRKKPCELILMKLPNGPTAFFKLSAVKLSAEIHHHGNPTDHYPELILNNFNTKLGRRIARFFASLFPQKPEFKARTSATFHNQRDFIFFRRHRYQFRDNYAEVSLQEIGPRFTLKLQKLVKGPYDPKTAEIEFNARADMYVSRKKMYI